jgi:hypothetical protein
MTQRSGQYVVYRSTKLDDKGNTVEREFACSFVDADDQSRKMSSGDVPLTADPRRARVFDKKEAFAYALRAGNRWTVGELISTNAGVTVDE